MGCFAMSPPEVLLRAEHVYKEFARGGSTVTAVAGASLQVAAHEVIAFVGASGCGKTTLLHLLGGLERPDRGNVAFEGVSWASMSATAATLTRRRKCGFVFQSLALLPSATAAENVDIPLLLDRRPYDERREAVSRALAMVGLDHKATQYPDQLSGGEQQRVAIARAIVHRPLAVFADEPTGSLDSRTALDITKVLADTAREVGASMVIVTHDERVAAETDRVVWLDSGRIRSADLTATDASR